MLTAKPVEVLHCPVGNLWDVFEDSVKICRVTYHGERLVVLLGELPKGQRQAVGQAIDCLYR
jgi:hypothetical protein